MTTDPVKLSDLIAARDRMFHEVQSGLDANERGFLLSLFAKEPAWSLLSVEHLEQLPAVRWKLQHLGELREANAKKFAVQAGTGAVELETP